MFVHIVKLVRLLRIANSISAPGLQLLLLMLSLTGNSVAQGVPENPTLEPGKPIHRDLIGGQSHSYRILANARQYIYVVVDQRGIDVVVTLTDPQDKRILEVDSPNGTQGPESVFAITETSGYYNLEVRSGEKSAPAGSYDVQIKELRNATEKDVSRVAAERSFKEGELLNAQGTAESFQSAIKKYEEALALFRIAGYRPGEAMTLNNVGFVHSLLGYPQKALDYFNQALNLTRNSADEDGEAASLNNIGMVYSAMGQNQKALDSYQQALDLIRKVGDKAGEGKTLSNIGVVYDELGEKQKALDYFLLALPLLQRVGDRLGEARTLNNIGAVYADLGDSQRAIESYESALRLYRSVGDRSGEASTLNNLGLLYSQLGDKQKALDYYLKVLPLRHLVGDRHGEAVTLNNIGEVYWTLGEQRRAFDYLIQALPLYRAVGDKRGEATTLSNIGSAYNSMGESEKALNYYSQALPIFRAVGYRSGEATTLNSIGRVHYSSGQPREALAFFEEALLIRQAVADRRGEAITLNNIGAVYDDLGERRKAVDYYWRALPLRRSVGDLSGEGTTLGNLMKNYGALSNLRLAAFYGKQSVNSYQLLRSKVHDLDKDIQKTYAKSLDQTYRALAQILIAQHRDAEALQVVNAYKDEEFFDFDSSQRSPLRPMALTAREEEYATHYEKLISKIGATGRQLADLKRRLSRTPGNSEETGELQRLQGQFKDASDEFSAFLKEIEISFSKPADEKDTIDQVSDMTQMQAVLLQLNQETGQKAVAVYTIIGETKLHDLIVSTTGITSVSTSINGPELNDKARQLWGLLQSADYDPLVLSKELYKVIFAPIEDKLPKDTTTIMWNLDGNIRYLPMAALHDGSHYLVERYNHVVFTRSDKDQLTRGVSSVWTGYGFATSKGHTVRVGGSSIVFSSLDFANDEMQIFITKTHPNGIIQGDVFPEAQFNKAALLAIRNEPRPVVHISSHFRFRPGDSLSSFLLLGDGQLMTLADMGGKANLFQRVELLTLSACETAAQRPDATGREIDGFAELAQRLGAGAVLASLWSVPESSTSELMKRFYKNRQDRKYSKAEALRQAQLDLLTARDRTIPTNLGIKTKGTKKADEDLVVDKRYRTLFKVDRKKPFAHPYYWSPFVIFGNWR